MVVEDIYFLGLVEGKDALRGFWRWRGLEILGRCYSLSALSQGGLQDFFRISVDM